MDGNCFILDAHLHLWNPAAFTLGWLEGIDALNREFTPERYAKDIGSTAGAVYVEVDVAGWWIRRRTRCAPWLRPWIRRGGISPIILMD